MEVHTEALSHLVESTAVIVSGTSLDVSPAASLLAATSKHAPIIDFNTASPCSGLVDYWVPGDANVTLRELTQKLLMKHYEW